MKYLQRLGKSLMLPVSIMPIAALLKGIGYWIDPTGWGIHNPIAALLIAAGGAIIDNLPILFAIAVAMEMSKKRDTAIVLSALACYMMMTTILSSKCIALMLQIPEYAVDLAFHNTQSAFIGILVGLIVAISFQKFDQKRLPQFLAFFDGKRFASIISIGITLLISLIFIDIWPMCYHFFIWFGKEIANFGPISAGIYGVLNRLLIPTGNLVSVSAIHKRRTCLRALFGRVLTARAERAAACHMQPTRHIALQNDTFPFLRHPWIRIRHRAQKGLRIGMQRMLAHLIRVADLHDPS